MNNVLNLVKGELSRLNKYNITAASLVVALIWIVIMFFLDSKDVESFMVFIFFVDATSMTLLLIGANLFFEKKENTLSTILVTPSSEDEILLSKVVSSIVSSLMTYIILAISMYFLKDISINYFFLGLMIIVVVIFHSFIGFVFSFFSKNFTGLLMWMFAYLIGFMLPVFFAWGDIIPEKYHDFMLILPPQASLKIIEYAGGGNVELFDFVFSLIYLIVLSLVFFIFIVRPTFHEYAIKESGV